MKVLVVEDAEGMRKIVAAMLRNLGYEDVATAENGAVALEFITDTKIDLLVTNWNMPVMDGLQLVRQLRQVPRYANLPVLLFTSKTSRQDVVVAMQAGVDGYLTKPFSPPQLRDQLTNLLERLAEKRVARIMADLDPVDREDDHPLVIIGDAASGAEQLKRSSSIGVVDLTTAMLEGTAAINASSDEIDIGVALYSSSNDISRLVKTLGRRVKALLVTSLLPGGGVSFAAAGQHQRPL